MSILILAANTGRGHVSVMNTLHETFKEHGYHDVICKPDFYESILPVNKMLSDFYNFLLSSSVSLCDKYVEFNSLTRPEKNDDIYQMTKEKYKELFQIKGLEAIISTATSINYNLIRAMKEEGVYGKLPFYIIVTDPYDPIAPGFDSIGATRYFCANEVVAKILENSKVPNQSIVISGYPIAKRFYDINKNFDKSAIMDHFKLRKDRKVIIMNSGAQGNIQNMEYLVHYLKSDLQENFIMLCGVNKALYKLAKMEVRTSKKENVVILPFYEHMDELLSIADIYITKAGANSFYESLASKTALLIDAVDGLVYQERGVEPMLEELGVGKILHNIENFIPTLQVLLEDETAQKIEDQYTKLFLRDGRNNIIHTILNDLQSFEEDIVLQ